MRVQFAISFGVAAVLIVALVLYVHHAGESTSQEAPVTSAKAVKEENREADILVRQDQTPHVVALPSGASPADALRKAVVAYVTHQVGIGVIQGPLGKSSCTAVKGGSSARQTYRCDVTAADVTYPFYGVVVPAKHAITYCKRDAPPIPSMSVPLSRRCV